MHRTFLVILAGILLAGCAPDTDRVLLGTLERDRIELVAESHEPIIGLLVREGDRVTKGQVLARLDPSAIDTRLAQARAAVAQAEGLLAERVTGPRREEILAARARLAGAQARLEAADKEYQRLAELVGRRLLPQNDLDRQRAARDGALAERDAAREELLALERGTRSEVLDQAQAALAAATAQLAELEISRGRLDLTAPRDGIVDALPYKLGDRPARGAPVVVMLTDGAPYARVFVPEPVRAGVQPGTEATVRIDGTGRDWKGRVRYVSTDAAFTPYYALNERDRSRLSFLAEVELVEEEAAALPAGMPVEVEIAAGGAAQ
jgi:HlyD family secretion protein